MSDTAAHANSIVNHYSAYSAAAGLIAIPLVDFAAVTALELKMISELSKVYGIPFVHDRGKAIVGALTGGVGAANLAYGAGGRLLAAIPLVGPAVALASGPLFAYAATYAIGKVFVQHFETGGTFLDFDPEKMKTHYREHFDHAKSHPVDVASSPA